MEQEESEEKHEGAVIAESAPGISPLLVPEIKPPPDVPAVTNASPQGFSDDFTQDFSKMENEARGNWADRYDFMFACLGYAVGLGNVWRFPYLCYKNGGAVFLIPYFIMLFFVGIPLFFLELSLGQFTSMGPLTCWEMAPVFKGVGIAMCLVSAFIGFYYNVVIAWSLYYTFLSFTDTLPWATCDLKWSTYFCRDFLMRDFSLDNCTMEESEIAGDDGVCYNNSGPRVDVYGRVYNNIPIGIYNQTLARENGIKPALPAEEYLNGFVLGFFYSTGYGDLGNVQPHLLTCLLFAWAMTLLCLIKGISSSGKVVYVTAVFPYVMLIILLFRGVTLDGAGKGIRFFITEFELGKLADARVWKDAAGQIFLSSSASMGGLIMLASFNRFHYDVYKTALLVSFLNCATSVLAGIVIFAFIGFLATKEGVEIDELVDSGITLAFVIYPTAIAEMPGAPMWSVIFFLMLITLGLDSEFALVEVITTAFIDQFTFLREHKTTLIMTTCAFGFAIGVPMVTQGGLYVFALFDHYGGGWNLLLNGLFECVCIGWVYGLRNYRNDLMIMIGGTPFGHVFKTTWWWWFIMWGGVTQFIIMFVLFFSLYDYDEPVIGEYTYPATGVILGWCVTMLVVLCHVVTPVIIMYMHGIRGQQGLLAPFTPSLSWGPYLPKHRRLMLQYRDPDSFDPDPWEVGEPMRGSRKSKARLSKSRHRKSSSGRKSTRKSRIASKSPLVRFEKEQTENEDASFDPQTDGKENVSQGERRDGGDGETIVMKSRNSGMTDDNSAIEADEKVKEKANETDEEAEEGKNVMFEMVDDGQNKSKSNGDEETEENPDGNIGYETMGENVDEDFLEDAIDAASVSTSKSMTSRVSRSRSRTSRASRSSSRTSRVSLSRSKTSRASRSRSRTSRVSIKIEKEPYKRKNTNESVYSLTGKRRKSSKRVGRKK